MREVHRPHAVAFDVNETLTDLSSLSQVFAHWGWREPPVHWWFAVLLRDGMALTATGDTGHFAELAIAALEEVAGESAIDLPGSAPEELMLALREISVRADVLAALDRLSEQRVPAYALTNGSADFARSLLERGDVAHRLTDVISVDAVSLWKPRAEPYRYAADSAGVDYERLALVAVHPWDIHGATRAGLLSGWVNRTGRPYPRVFAVPTVEAPNLLGVVDQLLALEDD